jgi:hypothetical protein
VRDHIPLDDVVAKLQQKSHRACVTPTTLLAQDRHRAAIVDAAREHVGDDMAEHGRSVRVEQGDGGRDHRTKVSPRVDPSLEQSFDRRHLDAESIAPFEVARFFLLRDQRRAMLA